MTNDNSNGVGLNANGHIILDSSKINLLVLWVANSGEGTVFKLDTKRGAEIGRFITCFEPSCTAVDLVGNVSVACRGDGGVIKIAIDEATCIDGDGNGTVETSKDSKIVSQADECILFATLTRRYFYQGDRRG